MQFPSERVEHATTVLAHAMDPDARNPLTVAGRTLNVALHAMLTHEKWRGLVIPERAGIEGEGVPEAEAFDKIRTKALDLGESLLPSWDGWSYPWVAYAERYLRYIECVYTYRVSA